MRIVTDGPRVFLVGAPCLDYRGVREYLTHAGHGETDWVGATMFAGAADVLCEMGGRVCYDSFSRRRPGGTEEYLRRIKEMGHGRVLEHAVYSFVLADVSRACSHELYTHTAGWSRSMRSTRYVDEGGCAVVCPPGVAGDPVAFPVWRESVRNSVREYQVLFDNLLDAETKRMWPDKIGRERKELFGALTPEVKTAARKRCRQGARYLLPHSLATTVFATANARALRHFFETRTSPFADVEIRQLAGRMWEKVVQKSPHLFGDYERKDLGDGTFSLETPWKKV